MARIDGRKLGSWSLRLDAAYVLVIGVFVAITAPSIATVIPLPVTLVFVIGVIVFLWSGIVLWMVSRLRLRLALQLVLAVNIVATVLVAATSFIAVSAIIVFAVLAIAIEVALFALSQATAIRRIDAQQVAPITA